MKSDAESTQAINHQRQAEAAKTTRLRALRLAKEAADKEAAVREAAANPGKSKRRRASGDRRNRSRSIRALIASH